MTTPLAIAQDAVGGGARDTISSRAQEHELSEARRWLKAICRAKLLFSPALTAALAEPFQKFVTNASR
ncbi:hypothetical protein LVJ94_25725 [Pendulispora rubella]|uniref:Uncharacterized protein n=1 Tax=Pendulispora rubella TaxID=2741070 RepID=A0ABZ2LI39_9BACT